MAFVYKLRVARRIKIKKSLFPSGSGSAPSPSGVRNQMYKRKSSGTHLGPPVRSKRERNRRISTFEGGLSTGNHCHEWTVSNQSASKASYYRVRVKMIYKCRERTPQKIDLLYMFRLAAVIRDQIHVGLYSFCV